MDVFHIGADVFTNDPVMFDAKNDTFETHTEVTAQIWNQRAVHTVRSRENPEGRNAKGKLWYGWHFWHFYGTYPTVDSRDGQSTSLVHYSVIADSLNGSRVVVVVSISNK